MDGVLFNKDKTELLVYPNGRTGTSYSIPDSVIEISYRVFDNCKSLKSVTLGSNFAKFSEWLFDGNVSLSSINVSGNNKNYCSVDGVLFNKDKTKLLFYPRNRAETSYSIPNGVTEIYYSAFGNCKNLVSVTIPDCDDEVSIPDNCFDNCTRLKSITINCKNCDDVPIFVGCTSLERINISDNNKELCSVDGVVYNKDKTELARYPANKPGTSYTIPDSVRNIYSYAFYECSRLTSITIPSEVNRIGNSAFQKCTGLKTITIPNGIKEIDGCTFEGCKDLTSVIIPNGVKEIKYDAFSNCTNLKTISIPASVTGIGKDATYSSGVGYPGKEYDNEGAFLNCPNLTAINVDKNNTKYSSKGGVLYSKDMTKLVSCPASNSGKFTVSEGVTEIDIDAFDDCNKITSVTLPNSLGSNNDFNVIFYRLVNTTEIVVNANNPLYSSKGGILYDKSMTEIVCCPRGISGNITIPNGVSGVCLYNLDKITSVTVSKGAGTDHFWINGCPKIETLILPEGVGSCYFHYCENLKSIALPDSAYFEVRGCISGCPNLTEVTYKGKTIRREAGMTDLEFESAIMR